MIERLNFYDLYGYLLPGSSLVGVLWFPFWFVAGYDPPAVGTSALVVLVLGYLAGHVLASFSVPAFPHTRPVPAPGLAAPTPPGDVTNPTAPANRRAPSDYLLERPNITIADDVKTALFAAIQQRFAIDVRRPQPMPDDPRKRADAEAALAARRETAFLLCRRALLQHGVGSYAEQFEGLYTLMRGWATVAWMCALYHAGWAIEEAPVGALAAPPAFTT